MTQYHITWLRIKQEIWEQICKQAHEQNRSYSNMIGTMIKDCLERTKSEPTKQETRKTTYHPPPPQPRN